MTDGFLLTKWLLAATVSGISLLAIPSPPIPIKNLPGGYSAVGLTDDSLGSGSINDNGPCLTNHLSNE